jgi:hypothetical protein
MKRAILMIILLVIIAGVFIGYRMYREETPDVVSEKPDHVTDVKTLVEAFQKDTAAAAKKYLDRIIEVTGTVKSIDTSGTIVLGDNDTESVTCGLDRRHMKDYERTKPGAVAVIQGVCAGYERGEGDDLLSSLGTTVQLRSAGIKKKE